MSAGDFLFCGEKMPTEKKIEQVKQVKEYLKSNPNIILTDYRGLSVSQIRQIRNKLREKNIAYKVVKNRLMKIAVQDVGITEIIPMLDGPVATAFNIDEAADAAKAISGFTSEFSDFEIKGGFLDGQLLTSSQIKQLSKLPGREQLVAQLLGTLLAPVSSLARVINAPVQSLAMALRRIEESKASA